MDGASLGLGSKQIPTHYTLWGVCMSIFTSLKGCQSMSGPFMGFSVAVWTDRPHEAAPSFILSCLSTELG